jgi:hypothetical protein
MVGGGWNEAGIFFKLLSSREIGGNNGTSQDKLIPNEIRDKDFHNEFCISRALQPLLTLAAFSVS